MSLLDLINLRGEEILKDKLTENNYYNFYYHNQILKTLPKYEQLRIKIKYDQPLLKSLIKNLRKLTIHTFIVYLYPDFCEYFQTEI